MTHILAKLNIDRLVSYPPSLVVTVLRRSVARMVVCQAELLHQWRISGPGLARVAGGGGALLVYHHGAVPADYIYTIAWLYLHTGRLVHSVVHRHLLLVPGLQTIAEVMSCSAPSREECLQLVSSGQLVGVAPGGAGQAMLGLDWRHRRGYATVAALAGAPIITLNTANIDLAYTASPLTRPLSHMIYTCTKLALVPVYGGCPVPLHSHLDVVTNSPAQDAETLSALTYFTLYHKTDLNYSPGLLQALAEWFKGDFGDIQLRW